MEAVRKLRIDRGWTQRKLAHEARTSQHTIGEIELGLRDPHPTTLRKIAEAFGVSEAELLAEEADMPEAPGSCHLSMLSSATPQLSKPSEPTFVI